MTDPDPDYWAYVEGTNDIAVFARGRWQIYARGKSRHAAHQKFYRQAIPQVANIAPELLAEPETAGPKPVCPACGSLLAEVRCKLTCPRCRHVVESCADGGAMEAGRRAGP